MGRDNELEVGGSWARGGGFDLGAGAPDVKLEGADISYRHFGTNSRRLLARAEYLRRRRAGTDGESNHGYYGFLNYRLDRFRDVGMLYDWSEIPNIGCGHESALGLVYTHQFSEQVYVRLQLTRGTRPGEGDYNEFLFQWTWGVGPHRHSLE